MTDLELKTASSNPKVRALSGIDHLKNIIKNTGMLANYPPGYIKQILDDLFIDVIKIKGELKCKD